MGAAFYPTVESILRDELAALRRVVRGAWSSLRDEEADWRDMARTLDPAALRAKGDEAGAAAVEAALMGAT